MLEGEGLYLEVEALKAQVKLLCLESEALKASYAALHSSHHELRNKFNKHATEGEANRERLDVLWHEYKKDLC